MVIVESEKSFQKLIDNIKNNYFIIIPVLNDIKKHASYNIISILYFYFFQTDEEFLISFTHSDCIKSSEFEVIKLEIINSKMNKFVIDKKDIQHLFKSKLDDTWQDVLLLEYLDEGKITTNFLQFTPAHKFVYRKHYKLDNLNLYVPITKHIEYLNDNKNKIIKILHKTSHLNSSTFTNLNNIVINNFYQIEKNGMRVNKKFKRRDLVDNNLTYLKYKIYSTTSRPSCAFNSYNFMAINKNDGSREPFVSRFKDGYMLLIDYSAYHFHLIANLIGEQLKTHPYNFIGRIIFDKVDLTSEEYNQAKEFAFSIVYGGIPKELLHIPFFNKTQKLIDELYSSYKKDKYVITKNFNRKMTVGNEKMTPNKLFNYYLQSYETENNMLILDKIFQYIDNYNSKIVMYIYDSILIDFDINDGVEFINKIIVDMEQSQKFPVSIQYGKNYNSLIKFERNLYL